MEAIIKLGGPRQCSNRCKQAPEADTAVLRAECTCTGTRARGSRASGQRRHRLPPQGQPAVPPARPPLPPRRLRCCLKAAAWPAATARRRPPRRPLLARSSLRRLLQARPLPGAAAAAAAYRASQPNRGRRWSVQRRTRRRLQECGRSEHGRRPWRPRRETQQRACPRTAATTAREMRRANVAALVRCTWLPHNQKVRKRESER